MKQVTEFDKSDINILIEGITMPTTVIFMDKIRIILTSFWCLMCVNLNVVVTTIISALNHQLKLWIIIIQIRWRVRYTHCAQLLWIILEIQKLGTFEFLYTWTNSRLFFDLKICYNWFMSILLPSNVNLHVSMNHDYVAQIWKKRVNLNLIHSV